MSRELWLESLNCWVNSLYVILTRAEGEGSVVALRGQVPDDLVAAAAAGHCHRALEVVVLVAVEPHPEAARSRSWEKISTTTSYSSADALATRGLVYLVVANFLANFWQIFHVSQLHSVPCPIRSGTYFRPSYCLAAPTYLQSSKIPHLQRTQSQLNRGLRSEVKGTRLCSIHDIWIGDTDTRYRFSI